ncbi:MAG: histidinol-phosphatase HisJ family protein [Eubacteriales bacterium]
MHEQHCHSIYSGDVDQKTGATIDLLCQRAAELGLSSVAITDHLEIQQVIGCIFPPLDHEGILRDITAAKAKFEGKTHVIHGLELAQACHDIEETESILSKYKFDFIIGSVHAVRGFPDFSEMDYGSLSESMLKKSWDAYLSELSELVSWGGFDTLAHITYPYRYIKEYGRGSDINLFEKGRDYFETPLKRIIEKGIALEVNTSGLRQSAGVTFPHSDLIKFYRELGGSLVTVGSDAHRAADLALGIKDTYKELISCGFTHIVTFEDRKPRFHRLDTL